MLSKIDIEKELQVGGINIFPLNLENFKENSINLCVGDYAWTLDEGCIFYDDQSDKFVLEKPYEQAKKFHFSKHDSIICDKSDGRKHVILLPQSTTLIQTKETIAVGSNIGGTYHSKVGLVSQGIGHIGTMLGPNFHGLSLIAIHNVSKNLIELPVGESFVSVVFHYLDTPLPKTLENPTVSGHVDKMAQWGIILSAEEERELNADWRKNLKTVREKMIDSEEYKRFEVRKKEERKRNSSIRSWLTKRNCMLIAGIALLIVVLYIITTSLDAHFNTTEWSNRFWTIISSGIFVTIIGGLLQNLKREN